MSMHANLAQWIMGIILLLSAIGVISLRKPIYASLSFLLSLLLLAAFYLQLSAEFIAVMQVLIYAGAILVIFVFVIVLFQDAHHQIARFRPQSRRSLLMIAGIAFVAAIMIFGIQVIELTHFQPPLPQNYGTIQSIGRALYIDFFFPFEAIVVLFLVAIIGSLYIAKKEG